MADLILNTNAVQYTARDERAISVLACWPIYGPNAIFLINFALPRTDYLPASIGALVVYGLLAVTLALSLKAISSRLTPAVAAITALLILAFAVMAAIDTEHSDFYLQVGARSLLLAVPWLLVANAVREGGKLLRYLYMSAVVAVVAAGLRVVFPAPQVLATTYSQYDGYLVLPTAVIFADDFFRRRRVSTLLLLVVAVGLLFSAGARGPLFAFILYLLIRAAVTLRRRPFLVGLIVVAGTALTSWFNIVVAALLKVLVKLFSSQGLSTRALDRLINGDFLQDEARLSLAGFAWSYISRYPVTGVGVARDRLLMADAIGEYDPAMISGWYPHNFVLEVLLQYGVFVGGALLLSITVLIIRAVLSVTDPDLSRIVLIFTGIGLWPLLVSGSYLTSPLFFTLLGLCLSMRSRRREQSLEVIPQRVATDGHGQ